MLSLRQIFVAGAFMAGAACGLRTDPGSGGTGVGGACLETETDGAAPAGSCMNPFPVAYQSGERITGNIDGCSEGQSWCGGSGGEDYYKYVPHRGDVKITFNPVTGGVEPLLRVIRVPAGGSPCGNDIADEDTHVCTAITNADPSWNFYAGGAEWEYYIVVDSVGGSTGPYDMTLEYGFAAVGAQCRDQIPVEDEVIVLGRGGSYSWEATLPADTQGRTEGKCGGPGAEDLFIVSIIEPGTLHVAVEAIGGGLDPVATIFKAPGCAGESTLRCTAAAGTGFAQTDYTFSSPTTRFISVDQSAHTGGSYRMTAWMD